MTSRSPFSFQNVRDFWASTPPDPEEQVARFWSVERNVILPVKWTAIALITYFLFFSEWSREMPDLPQYGVAREVLPLFFSVYIVFSIATTSILLGMRGLPLKLVSLTVLAANFMDCLFLAVLSFLTLGFDSPIYWMMIGLTIRNTVSIPIPTSQLALNLIVCATYIWAGISEFAMRHEYAEFQLAVRDRSYTDEADETYVLRILLMLLVIGCCYGVQVLFERKRKVDAEAREFSQRQQQLQAAGRLAAEIAHQLKNPLGIINNAAFTLQKTVKEGKTITQQIKIIREEVERSDRIITELMGYAKLVEGRVEKLEAAEELDRAIQLVLPPAAKFEITVHRDYAAALPPLLLQRAHLEEVFVNLLINAREAMNGKGNVWVKTEFGEDYSVVVILKDDGPGIDPEHLQKIFEPYFTTKEKGTGLGLAIVRHNAEIYGGSVIVESELGHGTQFTIRFPARTLMTLRK